MPHARHTGETPVCCFSLLTEDWTTASLSEQVQGFLKKPYHPRDLLEPVGAAHPLSQPLRLGHDQLLGAPDPQGAGDLLPNVVERYRELTPPSGARVYRGGNYNDEAGANRAAFRSSAAPADWEGGFRPARTLP